MNKEASKTAERGLMHGVPWADDEERDQMVREARGA
jgi:hypothetical protein